MGTTKSKLSASSTPLVTKEEEGIACADEVVRDHLSPRRKDEGRHPHLIWRRRGEF